MAFIPDTHTDTAGNRQRFFHLSGNALPFLTMRQTTNTNPVNGRKHIAPYKRKPQQCNFAEVSGVTPQI